ncbi:MAG: SUMF1/EgtB/PvdO family nonheme iron enzyme, partial [Nitrospinae bacterium]|nr:SUMF1/EgtB/PvdO family nonheme iron enzyme [Nitrospinota bacterium]
MTFTGDKRMRFNAVLIALLFLLAVAVPCAHAQKPKKKVAEAKQTVVLLPILLHGEQSRETSSAYQDAITESLQSRYEVIAGSKVEEVLKKVTTRESQKEQCDLTRCYGAIAVEFNSEYLAVLNVTKSEGDYSLSIKIMDVIANTVVTSKTDTCRGCKMVDVVDKLKTLAGGEKKEVATSDEAPPENEPPAKAGSSKDAEVLYWNSIKDGKNADDFSAYLEDYPKGKFAGLAKRRMASLRKEKADATINAEFSRWDAIKESAKAEDFEAYLKDYPKGKLASLAKSRIKKIHNDQKEASQKAAEEKAAVEKAEEAKHPGMVFVKKGDGGFWMDKYLVTQEAYEKVIGSNPSYFKNCPTCPVENVDWDEASNYCHKVGKVLPNEKDWEYSASENGKNTWAGTSNESELGHYAWYEANSGRRTHPVGEKRP